MAFRGNPRHPASPDPRLLGQPRLRGSFPGMLQLMPSASPALLTTTPPVTAMWPGTLPGHRFPHAGPGRPPNPHLGSLMQGMRGLAQLSQRPPPPWPPGAAMGPIPTGNIPVASAAQRLPTGVPSVRGAPGLLSPPGVPPGAPVHPNFHQPSFTPQGDYGAATGIHLNQPNMAMMPQHLGPQMNPSDLHLDDVRGNLQGVRAQPEARDIDERLRERSPGRRGRKRGPSRQDFRGDDREAWPRNQEVDRRGDWHDRSPRERLDSWNAAGRGEDHQRPGDQSSRSNRDNSRYEIRARAERRREEAVRGTDLRGQRGDSRDRREDSRDRRNDSRDRRDDSRDWRSNRRGDREEFKERFERDGRSGRLDRSRSDRDERSDRGLERSSRSLRGDRGSDREGRSDRDRASDKEGKAERGEGGGWRVEKDRGSDRKSRPDRDRGSDRESRPDRDYRPDRGRRYDDRKDRRSNKGTPDRSPGRSSDSKWPRKREDRSSEKTRDMDDATEKDSSRDDKENSPTPPPPGTFSLTLPNKQAMEVLMSLQDESDEEEEELNLEGVENGDGYVKIGDSEDANDEELAEPAWVRCSPADLYFKRERETNAIVTTKKMRDLEDKVESEINKRAEKVRAAKPKYEPPPRPNPALIGHHHHHHNHQEGSGSSSDSSTDEEEDDDAAAQKWIEELNRKKQHPERLHEELWFNEPHEMNDGPLCRCSVKSQQSGIRHDIYPGETDIPRCDGASNNASKLFHYRITMSPHTNFLTKNPTIIEYDNHEYIFEGFSLFSHYKLQNVPICKVIRFNIEYTIHWFEEDMPDNFSVRSTDLFTDFLFYELLELLDLDWKAKSENSCSRFHLMPRFARDLPDNGKEILSMNEVLQYLMKSSQLLLESTDLKELLKLEKHEWQELVDKVRGMIVTFPGKRPSSIRIDQLDREEIDAAEPDYPMIIHFGIRPAQLSYAGDPNYQKLWKQYVKFKHLLANKPKVTLEDKQKLLLKEEQLQEMRTKSSMKREVTVAISGKGFFKTGIKSDVCQHAMLLPVLIGHLRFHKCLEVLQDMIQYKFKDRLLLQLALTHPSYRVNFGTNSDHARNSLSNCGIRLPEYGDRRIHHVHTRKRGINTLINIMSRLGRKEETSSEINHYERLEFLGDAVVEFLSSIHLFFMFPSLEEGGLATYRAAIVQNQHLAVLAKKLKMQDFMLYAHGPDLCHESDLRHAMANCLEALMGALFLDGGIDLADKVFGKVLFDEDEVLDQTWMNLPPHPLQEDEPNGDRHWITSSPALQKLLQFEDMTGIQFNHIRLLARSFTMRNVGYNNLTFGHNQRLEFLGDTVLQLVASGYLFKHFPEHHEGHLSLLRSSLVNNRTQAVVCDDLGMTDYIIHAEHRALDQTGMKHKEKADLLEAFIGALYVDHGLEFCRVFCHVCFFPRLKQFILNQDWNDPKSQLQQCCLTLRELDGGEPDIPVYKVIASTGPTNTRKYTVAVYFRGERLATGVGHSIQQAEMNAATNALQDKSDLFPQLAHQKRFIERKYKRRKKRGGKQSLDSGEKTPEKK